MSRNVAVIGGSLSGLSSAFFIQRKLPKSTGLTIFEKSSFKTNGDFMFDPWFQLQGVHGSSDITSLLKLLHLDAEVIAPNRSISTMGGIPLTNFHVGHKIDRMPSRTSAFRFAHLLISEFFRSTMKSPTYINESVYSFCIRHGLPQSFIDKYISSYCISIYGQTASKIEMSSSFSEVWAREYLQPGHNGSILRSSRIPDFRSFTRTPPIDKRDPLTQLISFKGNGQFSLKDGGCSRLEVELSEEILFHGANLKPQTEVMSIQISDKGLIRVNSKNGDNSITSGDFDACVLAAGSGSLNILRACEGKEFLELQHILADFPLLNHSRTSIVLKVPKDKSILGRMLKKKDLFSFIPTYNAQKDFQNTMQDHPQSSELSYSIANIKFITRAFGNQLDPQRGATADDQELIVVDVVGPSPLHSISTATIEALLRLAAPNTLQLCERDTVVHALRHDEWVAFAPGFASQLYKLNNAINRISSRLSITGACMHGVTAQEVVRDGRLVGESVARRLIDEWRRQARGEEGFANMSEEEMMSRGVLRFLPLHN